MALKAVDQLVKEKSQEFECKNWCKLPLWWWELRIRKGQSRPVSGEEHK